MQGNETEFNQASEMQGNECFLCTLDPKHTCHTPNLSGYLVAIHEGQHNGERLALLVLNTGTAYVEIEVEDYFYRGLIKEFKERGASPASYHLKLQIYHLPSAPEAIAYKTQTRQRYRGNAYTLTVLEPDILLNITDLNQADYCTRQYLLKRLVASGATEATIRGNLVHYCFKELLKEHDRGTFLDENQETPLQVMERHLTQAIANNQIEIGLADVPAETMRAEVIPHLERLARWYERESNTLWTLPGMQSEEQSDENQVRAETFLLAPEIGLRGRLDLFWQQTGQQRLLELKTGGATGELPKRDHRWQVFGYHALLAVRRQSKMKRAFATLLYSGTPDQAQSFGIKATIRDIQRVNETRNILMLNRITGIPSAPPGPSRCTPCSMLKQCRTLSSLLQWQAPVTDEQPKTIVAPQTIDATDNRPERSPLPTPRPFQQEKQPEDSPFFAHYYRLLQIEERANEQQMAQLWQTSVKERLERGSAIQGLEPIAQPIIQNDGWSLTFHCQNTSELREGDEILLSDGDPITGEVVSGTITGISSGQLIIWSRELIAQPQLVDRYDNDLVHVRTLQNLLRWHYVSSHLQDLVAGKIRPRFKGEMIAPRPDFNAEQNLAVTRALQMQDYLLIQGPPGTGKTSVIAEIVTRLVEQGQTVMLAAFTNQAVDNMLKRLVSEGFEQFLRLGSERSVHTTIKPWLLKEQLDKKLQQPKDAGTLPQHLSLVDEKSYQDYLFELLYTTPVVASTTATWSSDKYAPHTAQDGTETANNSGFLFDVAIIDEAGQLTVPAILGALRFARRFILVGDEKQLPPLVLSKEAAEAGLAASLFSFLKQKDEEHIPAYPLEISACVPLRTQYRMNKWISHFSSTVFYDGKLQAHPAIANRQLEFPHGEQQRNRNIILKQIIDPKFPVTFMDVRDEQASAEAKQSNAEAEIVREIVQALLTCGIHEREIGIIAPYRAQVANIRRHLFTSDATIGWQALPSTTPLNVDTVDRFQGGERMIIILSFATTSEPAPGSQRRDFLSNSNRLNVALTRAQRKLILVGNVPALENLPIFQRLITYCRSMRTLHSAQGEIHVARGIRVSPSPVSSTITTD
ncbi:AAA domain-containing protein [Dictyobacter arantiisoli]|uniref:DNA helicase n=1 Tax=Dictyobacter arantiisoli TaxID=2014874 RepID=A0A5A5TA43_9CHLR|nr:AAA domain-containing protein [Dictyobacter arantiisoli]GCF08135.1 ATPase AAA [Dictyobacter arantiisoli]